MAGNDDHDTQLSPEAESSRYRPIKRLDESVVNRIAAGEIIHRPANALKELIENSLDAGATLIRITLKEGGIKTLQIQDNGSGIQPSDLPLLCERFATSKLRDFGDLESMSTFGFRGEALASISYVTASMNVVSKTRDQDCAFRAYYANGALAPPKPGQSSDPKQCAGTDGTLITAEDLFYNLPQRRRALRSPADEYNRALDVVSKYAVHYGGKGVGFVCRKAASNATDLNTPSSPTNTTLDTIRVLHGNAVARELVELKVVSDDQLGFSCQGWISGANWSSKRTTLLCFINNRLVDCPLLKRSIEAVYATLLPKGGHAWIYLAITINPANVDVNVHPTKKEVHFLNEDEIVERICQAAQERLAGANSSRTFAFSQAVLPVLSSDVGSSSAVARNPAASSWSAAESGGARSSDRDNRPALSETRSSSSSSVGSSSGANTTRKTDVPISSSKGYPRHLVRVDAKTRTLDAMFSSTSANSTGKKRAFDGAAMQESSIGTDAVMMEHDEPSASLQDPTSSRLGSSSNNNNNNKNNSYADSVSDSPPAAKPTRPTQTQSIRITDSDCSLTSVRQLRAQITKSQHHNLTEVVQNHTFVGVVDLQKGLSLIQHETRLLLVNHDALIREFAYQLILRQFGSLKRIRLDPAPSLDDLVRLGLESVSGLPSGEKVKEMKEKVVNVLLEHADMLEEYFSLCFNVEQRTLEAVPSLIPGAGGCGVELDRLPMLLVRLAARVNWGDEEGCFDSFARQVSGACLPVAPLPPAVTTSTSTFCSASNSKPVSNTSVEDENGCTSPSLVQLEAANKQEREEMQESAKRKIRNYWFNNMTKSRGRYIPSKQANKFVVQVANLPDLYRVFERC
ncbi:hypothetical protein NDA13_004506 [Ustilago tritici]|nr:hypothetical protein NDA13_004506 [Ustilago tritici]